MSVPVVLIPGAGGQGWGWHLVEAGLRERGYDAFAVDLPAADESQVARERLGLEPEVVPGGHLALLSRPAELSAALDRCLRAVSGSGAGRPT